MSEQILYRRIRTVNAGNDGRFELEPSLGGSSHVVIPRVGFTLGATRSVGTLSATATETSDFTSRASFTRAEETTVAATSTLTPAANAVDGNLLTEWRAAVGVTSAGFDVVPAAGITVDTVRVFPDDQAKLTQVRVDFLGDAGQVLDSRTEVFATPDDPENVSVSLAPPVSDVHQVSFVFDGDAIRVGEIEIVGPTSTDVGNAAADVVFTGTAGIRLEVTRASGEGLKSQFTAKASNGSNITANVLTGDDGVFTLMAPIPTGAAPVDFTITASNTVVGHQLLKTTAQAPALAPDTTSLVAAAFPETASITGQVTDSMGQPVSPQSVTVFPDAGGSFSVSVDAGGNFAFNDLPPDTYTLRIVNHSRLIFSPPDVVWSRARYVRQVDVAHPARADGLDDFVMGEALADHVAIPSVHPKIGNSKRINGRIRGRK